MWYLGNFAFTFEIYKKFNHFYIFINNSNLSNDSWKVQYGSEYQTGQVFEWPKMTKISIENYGFENMWDCY